MAKPSIKGAALTVMVVWVENEREGHFEHIGYFAIVEAQLEARLHQTDDREHLEARAHLVDIEVSDYADIIGGQADFFFGLDRGGLCPRTGTKRRNSR